MGRGNETETGANLLPGLGYAFSFISVSHFWCVYAEKQRA